MRVQDQRYAEVAEELTGDGLSNRWNVELDALLRNKNNRRARVYHILAVMVEAKAMREHRFFAFVGLGNYVYTPD